MPRDKEPDYGRRLAIAMAGDRLKIGHLAKAWAETIGIPRYAAAAVLSLFVESRIPMTAITYGQLLKVIRKLKKGRDEALGRGARN